MTKYWHFVVIGDVSWSCERSSWISHLKCVKVGLLQKKGPFLVLEYAIILIEWVI